MKGRPVIQLNETTKHVVDGVSLAAALASLAAWLPPLAAFASLVWTLIRIVETRTFQNFLLWLRGRPNEAD